MTNPFITCMQPKLIQNQDNTDDENIRFLTDVFAKTWPLAYRDLNWFTSKMGEGKINWQLLTDKEWVTVVHEKWDKEPTTVEEGMRMTKRQRIISGFSRRYPDEAKKILETEIETEKKKHENHGIHIIYLGLTESLIEVRKSLSSN